MEDTYNFRRNFRDWTGDRLARPSIVRHLKFDRIADFQMLDVATELAEMEEQSSLSLTALNKSVWMLQRKH